MARKNNNRRPRANDGYLGKVTFWTGQLTATLAGEGTYDLDRCLNSVSYFTAKAIEARAEKPAADELGAWMDANISFQS